MSWKCQDCLICATIKSLSDEMWLLLGVSNGMLLPEPKTNAIGCFCSTLMKTRL